jgi:hypothetical protein
VCVHTRVRVRVCVRVYACVCACIHASTNLVLCQGVWVQRAKMARVPGLGAARPVFLH